MSRYIISPPALDDLRQIDDYIGADNPGAADRVLASLRAAFGMLASTPMAGRQRLDFGENLRSFPPGSYMVFDRPMHDGVEIVRVLHGRRDMERAFREVE